LSQVIRYRWLALATSAPQHFALHHHPRAAESAEAEARQALGVSLDAELLRISDEDPCAEQNGPEIVVCSVPFGGSELGRLALAPSAASEADTPHLVALVACELGGPVRIAALMDEQQRLATVDALTGLKNRRAFMEQARVELARSTRYVLPLSLILLDVDHFKKINDGHGHMAGDHVLCALGALLKKALRVPDIVARWGGEEFVIALPNTDIAGVKVVAERLRAAAEHLALQYEGRKVPLTISLGATGLVPGETLEALVDRADRAMYAAKAGGRNCAVIVEAEGTSAAASSAAQ
jgi:two-component system, cell cycle response regulator